jgi:selenocysteine lyase/cysteine desulfurase
MPVPSSDDLVFVPNATTAMHAVFQSLANSVLKPKDKVLILGTTVSRAAHRHVM